MISTRLDFARIRLLDAPYVAPADLDIAVQKICMDKENIDAWRAERFRIFEEAVCDLAPFETQIVAHRRVSSLFPTCFHYSKLAGIVCYCMARPEDS